MKSFEPSLIWEVVTGAESFSNFCVNIIPDFKFSENVPDVIRNRFKIVRKLLEHSYFEYDFIDVAKEKTFQTFELALSLKYNQENQVNENNYTLRRFLDWAVKNKFLNITNDEKEIIAELRNHNTHLKQDSSTGMVGLKMIKRIGNELVNELFVK